MLLVAPNRSVDLEGLIGPYYRINLWWKSIEFHGAVWRVIYSNSTGLEGRIDASIGTESLDPPLQLIRIEL